MVGQEHVVQALSNALTQQRLHHAYLFTGTRGVGKTTVSRILAKSLNCTGVDGTGGITATPCGVCPACTEIDSGRFPDYTELDAASNRGVDEVQGLLEQAVYKPVQGRFKVFMIDEVHMLTNTAFNAMLKTLEEPPEYLKFVLATTDPQKVPVTVLSRCLQFNLRPMAPETVQSHLAVVLGQEHIPADSQSLRLLSRAARGSMRDALSLADQAIAFGSGQLQEASVRQMLGAVDSSHVFRLIEALAQGDGAQVVDTVDQLRHLGLSAASTLEDMAAQLQRMAVLQAVPEKAQALQATGDAEQAELLRLAQIMPADETQLLYSICLHGRTELGLAPDEYSALTMALLRLLAFKPAAPASGLAEKKTLNSAASVQPAARRFEENTPVAQVNKQHIATNLVAVAEAGVATPVAPPAAMSAPATPSVAAAVAIPASAVPAVVAPIQTVSEPTVMADSPAPVKVTSAPAALAPLVSEPVAAAAAVTLPVRNAEDLIPVRAPVAVAEPASAPALQEMEPANESPDDGDGDGDGDVADDAGTYEPDEDDGPAFEALPDEAYADEGVAPAHELPPAPAADAALIALPVQAHAVGEFDKPVSHFGESLGRVPAEFVATADGDFWNDVVVQLIDAEAVTAVARQLALRSQMLRRDGDSWYLQVDLESLAQPGTVERLRTALVAKGLAGKIEVNVGPVNDCPARRKAFATQQRQRAAEAVVHNDPYVQSLVQQFGAKIVPGSIQPI